jgi:hypothetical protein
VRLRDRVAANSAQMETNRQALHRADPDAARILTSSFGTGQHWKASPELLAQMASYSDLKYKQGRSDLYRAMFDNCHPV